MDMAGLFQLFACGSLLPPLSIPFNCCSYGNTVKPHTNPSFSLALLWQMYDQQQL